MTNQAEVSSQVPLDVQLRKSFFDTAKLAAEHIMTQDENDPHIQALLDAMRSYGLVPFTTTNLYEKHMERAGDNALRRPFGIEADTLSPHIQLVLYPQVIFHPSDELKKELEEEGNKVITNGPQAMLYVLDGFLDDTEELANMAANLYFVGHMADALLQERFPLETGERSAEFKNEIEKALAIVRTYVNSLPEERRVKLNRRIAKIAALSDEEMADAAQDYVTYHTEPMKMRGILEFDEQHIQETPKEVVENGTTYLHNDERDLQIRKKADDPSGTPEPPWFEYGKSQWNRSHQLFGRYQTFFNQIDLVVDFLLDSTHMPAQYGFFDTIEITRRTHDGATTQHIIFGQEVNREKEGLAMMQMMGEAVPPGMLDGFVFPVILAGTFDFTDPEIRLLLTMLATDTGTKPDVKNVIADILRLSEEGRLQTVEETQKEADST